MAVSEIVEKLLQLLQVGKVDLVSCEERSPLSLPPPLIDTGSILLQQH